MIRETVTLTTDLYRAEDGALLYTLDSTTTEKDSEFEIISAASKAIAKRLRDNNVIK
jgi:hypothetical protein